MKKILIIDVENIIYNTKKIHFNLLKELAKKCNGRINEKKIYTDNSFLSFYELYKKYFQLDKRNKMITYLNNYHFINSKLKSNYLSTLKNDDTLFLIQELKDIQKSATYDIIYAYWDKATINFMKSNHFREKFELNINKYNSYKWEFEQNIFLPNIVIDDFAKKNIAINNIIFLSNEPRMLRYLNSLGVKTLTLEAQPDSLESFIANKNIESILTANLIEILNEMI